MSTTERERPRAHLQELGTAVLAGTAEDDPDELLVMLLARLREDTAASTAALVLPSGPETWSIELVEGERAADLLGEEIPADSELAHALGIQDATGIEHADPALVLGALEQSDRTLMIAVDAGEEGAGAVALRRSDGTDFSSADAARADGIALLMRLALHGVPDTGAREVDDERGRIARDLHDLAIQELFAVGMELETLQHALAEDGVASPGTVRSVSASVDGIERAVAQIRQIVQSLRRERPVATVSERLRHETAVATAGLGFVPSLSLSPSPGALDAEVPEEIAEDIVAVVRECLANAARHARASAVSVAITAFSEGVDRVVQINVADNGRGIDPSVTRRSGLANMASRARRHQGWVDAIPLEPGTMISWRVTLPPL